RQVQLLTRSRTSGMKVLRRSVVGVGVALLCSQVAAQTATPPPVDLPLVGIASITFRVTDLDKARRYYQGVLGLPEAFTTSDAAGRVASVYFKVNDDQFVEIMPG